MLAQLDPESKEGQQAIAEGWWNLSFILFVGTVAVLFLITLMLLRRWKRRQLKAIEQDREERRAGQSIGRVDAWAASSDRYVDHDKLPDQDDAFKHKNDPGHEEQDEDDEVIPGSDVDNTDDAGASPQPDEEGRDPYGLFSDKPYQDPEDEDESFDEEDDEDWDDEEDDKP